MIMNDSDQQFDDDRNDDDADNGDAATESESDSGAQFDNDGPEGDGGNGQPAREGDDSRRRRRRGRSPGAGPAQVNVVPADERAHQALDFVTDIITQMGMECRVRLRRPRESDSPDEINIEISGKDAGRVIGKKGQVLQALQFLTHRVINRPGADRRHIMVDAEGYRSRRDDSLALMARRLGKQAVDEGKIITFEPMNPRDRRVVHLALAKFEGVITKSDGEGDDRRVQIIPVRRNP